MSLYNQHMKHWKNHRKDKYTQQTFVPSSISGYHMKDFVIKTKENGEYMITAYSCDDAKDRFFKYIENLTISSVVEV